MDLYFQYRLSSRIYMNNEYTEIDAEFGATQGTIVSYVIGFLFSILLTLVPYLLVTRHLLAGWTLALVIVGFGVAQLLVQLVFFLHVNAQSKARSNMIALVFTALMVLILAAGSLWIMKNLDYQMSATPSDHDAFML